jgi:WD40 repeat protein
MNPRSRHTTRRGIIALSELVVMMSILVCLLWLGSLLVTSMKGGPLAAATTKACSIHSVFRISLIPANRSVWIYRPREGVMQVNLDSGEVERSLSNSHAAIAVVAHSADGSTSLLGMLDGSLALFQDGEDALTADCGEHEDQIVDAVISHNGSVVACATMQGQVFGWSLSGGRMIPFAYRLEPHGVIMRLGMNPSGSTLLVASTAGRITFHDPATGVPNRAELTVDDTWRKGEDCTVFAWSHDERVLGIGAASGCVRTYELATGRVTCEGTIENSGVATRPTAIAVSDDGTQIAMASNTSPEISVWIHGEYSGRLKGHDGIVRSLQFDPAGSHLYSGSYDGTVREWSMNDRSISRVVD